MSNYQITPEEATKGTFNVQSKANIAFEGGVQQQTTDNSYGKAISDSFQGVKDWVNVDYTKATVDDATINALSQTDAGPQNTENFVAKAGEVLQPVMHRAEQIYLWNKADWAQSALDSGEKLGISADLIMASGQEGIKRAEFAASQLDRGKTIQEVREMYPELAKVDYKNSAEAIVALQNLEAINATRGVFDAIQQGVWSMNDQMNLGDVGFELAHTKDSKRIEELTAEMQRLQSNLQQYRRPDGSNPLENVFGDTAAQAYMMGKQGGKGAIVGAIVGGVVGGVATEGVGVAAGAATGAKWGGGADMAYEMYKMSFGNKYIELLQKRDSNGNRVYSNDEAYRYAMSSAVVDTGIEMGATMFMGKAIGKIAPKSVMAKAIAGATSDTVKTFDRGIGATVAQSVKAAIKSGSSELVEEGLQDVNEKLQHNFWRKETDPEGNYGVGDIVTGAGSAMWQALPAVVGLGVLGGGVSGVRTMKAFREFQKLSPEEQKQAVMAEQNRNGMAIMQALKKDATSAKYAKENPVLYGKIVQAQSEQVGVSSAYVNVSELAETEEGQKAIRDLVDAGLVTQEEVSKSIEANADVEIPIGSYAQMSGGLHEETIKALEESTYFTEGGMSLKSLERAKEEVKNFNKKLTDNNEQKAKRVKEDIINSNFENLSDVDREVLEQVFADPTKVKQNFNNLYKDLTQAYRETYAVDFDNMDNDIKVAHESGVNPTWYKDGKAPRSNAERRRAAYQSSYERTNAQLSNNPDALNQAGAHYADMEHMLNQIESLEALRDKVFDIADNDVALRMQLTKSGYEVYKTVRDAIKTSTDRKQRETAEANALIMASRADVVAQVMREAGNSHYTAMDWLNTVRIEMNAKSNKNAGYAQKLVMQQKIDSFTKQWSNVVDNQLNGVAFTRSVKVMDTPLVLQLMGVGGDIEIDPSIIHKIITGKHANQINTDDLKQLPNKIANPIAIFNNYDGRNKRVIPNEVVLILDMFSTNGKPNVNASGENLQVILTLTQTANGNLINKIKTITPRRNRTWYEQQIKNGNLRYANTKKINRLVMGDRQQMAQPITKQFIINNSIPTEKDLDNLRKQQNYEYYQTAWHGSPYDFDQFDLGKVGNTAGQYHGWGLYFARNEHIADIYKNLKGARLSSIKIGDDIYYSKRGKLVNAKTHEEVHGLDNDAYFLNEVFDIYDGNVDDVKQSLKDELQDGYDEELQRALDLLNNKSVNVNVNNIKPTKFKVEIPEEDTMIVEMAPLNSQSDLVRKALTKMFKEKHPNETFKDVYYEDNPRAYDMIVDLQEGEPKKFALKANSEGIEGIMFDAPNTDVAYVVFNDKVVNIIEKYNQSINGMTTIMDNGDRFVEIFKTADRSTFLHEMGHVFFDDIKRLAEMENAPQQIIDDWNALKEWSGWKDGEVQNTEAHEKFARGWEAYLREGKAPTKGLQRVFRQFSKWLTRIYRSVMRLGGTPPQEIQDIMARMIATQEDIESYAQEQALEQFESTKLYEQLSEGEQAKMQGYIADVKEKAKERVMRKFMKELDERPIKEWDDVKDDIQFEIEARLEKSNPLYKEHRRYDALGDAALVNTQYKNIENLERVEREELGATFNEAVEQEMESARNEFINDPYVGKSNEQIAEEWLLTSDGQMKLTEEESRIIKSQTNRDLAKAWELLEKVNKLDPNAVDIDEQLKPIEKELTKEQQLKKENSQIGRELNATAKELDTANDRIEQLKAQLRERIDAVRAIRDNGVGTISQYMSRARRELGDLTLSSASQYKKYQNQAVRDGKRADRALAVNKVEEALEAKQSQMLNQARARVAYENAVGIKKIRTKLIANLNRMTRPKNPIMVNPHMRYFYAHMAYNMGLTKYDGLLPTEGFQIMEVINAIDPDMQILGEKQGTTQLQDWIYHIFDAKQPRSFSSLTVSELTALEELLTGMYKNGRNDYEGSTILNEKGESISFNEAVDEILNTAAEIHGINDGNVLNKINGRSTGNAIGDTFSKINLELMKPETFLERLDGGTGGPAARYIYDPISRATQKFNEYQEVSMRRLAQDIKASYTDKELYNMRNDHLYSVGELRNLTKEQVIMLALNWGTESNRQRAMETAQASPVEMERAFQEYLTDKDWEFIIRTWEHINSFFPERSKVQEELYGNPLKKIEGITFSIGGRKIEGQYFPVVYDPRLDARTSDYTVEDVAKSMVSSNAIFGTGMSATKGRLDRVEGKSLMLDFDVIPNAITEAINHVTMRKAVTDVNKLVSNEHFQRYIVNKFGMDTYQYIRTWVRDNWQDEVSKMSKISEMVMTLKKNTQGAVMAGKMSVAIQNIANVPVAMHYLGALDTIKAIQEAGLQFYGYGTPKGLETRNFVFSKSVMMRERVQTLDKDLKKGLSIGGKGVRWSGKAVGGYALEKAKNIRDDINNAGFRLLSETDLALSIAIWNKVYKKRFAELQSMEGVSAEWVDQQAIEAGDKAVRDIFGSGDIKDTAQIQRRRNSVSQLITPFFSYANTLYNIMLKDEYGRRDRGEYAKYIKGLWYGIMMQALIMVAYGVLINGDDDEPEDLAKSFASEVVSQGTMGLPFIRDIANITMKYMLGERVFNKGNAIMALSAGEKFFDTLGAIASDKKDGIDVGRSLTQLTNRITGLSDTVTDGFWTLAKYGLTNTDAEIEDVIMAIIFDKRLKSKKEQKKKH